MKVLIAGANHASTMNSLTKGLRENGVQCKAISFDQHRSSYNDYTLINCTYPASVHNGGRILQGLKWRYYYFTGLIKYIWLLIWADAVVYYSYPTFNILRPKKGTHSGELYLLNKLVEKKFVWFTGSEVRDPRIELAINPFFSYAWNNPGYEYKEWESEQSSVTTQQLFANYNFKAIVWDQYPFLRPEIFAKYDIAPHASVSLEKDISQMPQKKNKVIVHAPTAPVAKGSEFIIAAMEALKLERKDFEFHLLQNLSNTEYQEILGKADILIDQLIWGSYGVAAQQALQSGKVVVGYLLEDRIEKIFGADCPIINANIDNLADTVNELLNMDDMEPIMKASAAYYQKMHSPKAVGKKLLNILNSKA